MVVPEHFILDLAENPHPLMLSEAIRLRRRARWWRPLARRDWRVYRSAMCHATGESSEAMEAWVGRRA